MMLFALGYGAEALALGFADPESHSWGIYGWIMLFTVIGWGASEFDSLAELRAGDLRQRLGVVKKIFAALGAGLITGLAILSYKPEWGKLAAYIATFAGAYGGASFITPIVQGVAGGMSGFIANFGNKIKATPDPPPQSPPNGPPDIKP